MVGERKISGHRSSKTKALPAWRSRRPWMAGVLSVWLLILGLLLLHSKHAHLTSSSHGKLLPSQHATHRSLSVRHATCDAAAQPSAAEVQQRFARMWGHSCVSFQQACYDQGSFVVFDPAHNPQQGGKTTLKALQLGNSHLDFREFGDVLGIMQYPEIIFRPGNSHEESPDLCSPVRFSNCARPVVLYLNHLFMYGDFWVRTMPTLINALHAPLNAWDTDYAIVVATGGQRLQAWQKLLLQPFSKHPITTLSAASSRALAYLPADEQSQDIFYKPDREQHSTSRTAARLLQGDNRHYNHNSHISINNSTAASRSHQQQRRQLRSQQHTKQQHKLTAQPPITAYGRCFESMTVCKLQDPRGFPDSIARPVWSGAQHVRQFWEQQYGKQYKQLLPQHQGMKAAGALRVVFAVRGGADVRGILNLQVSSST
eukprot:GHRQ01014574.1.p1 GENE.GHRQ01014574.1~~GHRQ01014574.1.p1  ORF type:complete len:428 (+),score=103.26 GHRQ01014574.1:101-1384(+)